jgi:hypothetical protein
LYRFRRLFVNSIMNMAFTLNQSSMEKESLIMNQYESC